MKRRQFIASSVALTTAAGAGIGSSPTAAAGTKAQVRRYQRLGKTDLTISDISCGAGRLPSASLVLRAFDRGINYVDTAPDYGRSEEYIGRALQRFKQRDKVYIASKFCHQGPYKAGESHLQAGSSVAEYIQAVEGSLRRLHTDYLDVAFVHAMGENRDYQAERQRLLDPGMLEAVGRLKEQGKVRYLAVSSHGPHNMERLMMEAVRSGHFDIVMLAFNFMKFPQIPDLLTEAQARGVGVVAMKTLAGAKDMDLSPGIDQGSEAFAHAAFKWVLKHPQVAGLVVTMKRARQIDEYLGASGTPFSAADQRLLDRYAARYGREYCRTGCDDCESRCPAGVAIASVLRYQMYFDDYGQEKDAMRAYAALADKASPCVGCESHSCVAACPHGLPVAAKLRAAHRDLSLA